MFATRGYNLTTPTWNLVKQVHVKKSGAWQPVKEIYTNKSGSWQKIWNRNLYGAAGSQHPFWQYSYNYNFAKSDDTLCWSTYFSTNNNGYYSYPSSNVLRLDIGSLDGSGAYGMTWLEPIQPLAVLPGQVYTHSVYIEGRSSSVTFSLRAYTGANESDAQKGASGKTSFETTLTTPTSGTTVSQSITVPSGNYWLRPYLYIETNATSLPRYVRFSSWSVLRSS